MNKRTKEGGKTLTTKQADKLFETSGMRQAGLQAGERMMQVMKFSAENNVPPAQFKAWLLEVGFPKGEARALAADYADLLRASND